MEAAERCYDLAVRQQAVRGDPQRQVARKPTTPPRDPVAETGEAVPGKGAGVPPATPRERGRLARNLIPGWRKWSGSARLPAGSPPAGVNGDGEAQRDPRRRCRSNRVADIPDAPPGNGAGGTPAFPGGHPPHIEPGTWFTSCPGIGQGAWISAQAGGGPTRRGESEESWGSCARRYRWRGRRRPAHHISLRHTARQLPPQGGSDAGVSPATPRERGRPARNHPGARASRPQPYFLAEAAERCYNLAGWQPAIRGDPQRQVPRKPTAPPGNAGVPPATLFFGGGCGTLARPCGPAAGHSR